MSFNPNKKQNNDNDKDKDKDKVKNKINGKITRIRKNKVVI